MLFILFIWIVGMFVSCTKVLLYLFSVLVVECLVSFQFFIKGHQKDEHKQFELFWIRTFWEFYT